MIPQRYAPQTYALMRIVFALVFLNYGLQKFGIFGGIDGKGGGAPFLSWPFGVAGLVEVVTGVLMLLGLGTKYAAFLASGQMAVAYFWVHHLHGIEIGQPVGMTPVQNGGQAAALFAVAFLYIATKGAGTWSVDEMIGGGDKA